MAIQLRLLDPDFHLPAAPTTSGAPSSATTPRRATALAAEGPSRKVRARTGSRPGRSAPTTRAPGSRGTAGSRGATCASRRSEAYEGDPRAWVLDDRTCEIGRRGVEEARRALAAAVARASAA